MTNYFKAEMLALMFNTGIMNDENTFDAWKSINEDKWKDVSDTLIGIDKKDSSVKCVKIRTCQRLQIEMIYENVPKSLHLNKFVPYLREQLVVMIDARMEFENILEERLEFRTPLVLQFAH